MTAKARILLVDDEPALLDGLRRTLRREPFEILLASCGEEAVATLTSFDVDAVVSDQDMPGMRGTELLSWIREHRFDTVRVLLTGRATLDVPPPDRVLAPATHAPPGSRGALSRDHDAAARRRWLPGDRRRGRRPGDRSGGDQAARRRVTCDPGMGKQAGLDGADPRNWG